MPPRLVLSHSLDVGLRFVVIESSLHSSVVPTRWESILFLHGFFRFKDFWRRRNAPTGLLAEFVRGD
jgi:hypothetical protein